MKNIETDGRTIRSDFGQLETQHISPNPAPRQSIAVVIGTQHSGIPLCSHILSLFGFDMADPAPPGAEEGEWERADIAAAHDRILEHFQRGQTQRPDLPLPARWWADPAVQAVKREVVGALRDRVDAAPFGFGDARAIRVLPLWEQICRELRLEPKFVICLRNPRQVALSLAEGDGAVCDAAEYRWLVSHMELFRYLGNTPICLIEYEDWLRNPRINLEKLSQFFGLQQVAGLEFVRDAATEIVNRRFGQQHMQAGPTAHLPAVGKFYRLLRGWSADPAARKKAADMIVNFASYQKLHSRRFKEYEKLIDRADDRAELQDILRGQFENSLAAIAAARRQTRHAVIAQLHAAYGVLSAGANPVLTECLERFAEFLTSPQRWKAPRMTDAIPGAGGMTRSFASARKLICHTGGPKTGSSALQLFFAHNSELLANRGIDYRNYPPTNHDFEITSGNGVPLAIAVLQRDSTDNFARLFDEYYGQNETCLISTEALARFTDSDWLYFKTICERLNIDPTFVMCVRNVFPFCVSIYHQAVKRHGEPRSIDDFLLETDSYPTARALRFLVDVFGKNKCLVLHYDTVQEKLGDVLLSTIGLDIKDFDCKHLKTIVNRRLTKNELDLMLQINRRFGQFINCAAVSDIMLYANPLAADQPYEPSDSWASLLEARHRSDMAWINDTFFEGRDTVKLYEPRKPYEPSELYEPRSASRSGMPGSILSNECWRNLSRWAAEHLASAEEDAVASLEINFRQYSGGELFPKWPEEIPDDFNPVEYLIANLDVLHAGANAYDHFVEYGLAEGRAYKVVVGG